MSEIKAGDVVSLKSSNHRFTVGRFEGANNVTAVLFYFDANSNELRKVLVPVAALQKVETSN
ncbi:hypothetical protein EGI11_03195 [Chryseobacterium sp. H3056]|uniref:Uncharacterized protein n=1 Tax=Kaistella daneshvariae TaxID=2487074 RepID=A0A3N0WXF9_9FLAO|nr:hypothetical protein [Kaistella daneshvariae]ROI09777.1 hypothetical protein EGI11_03195 [Kaistella daneshvariae]